MKYASYTQDNEFTYIKNDYVDLNKYKNTDVKMVDIPKYEDVKHLLPKPVWEGHSDVVDCYYRAWEIAFSNLSNPKPESGFVSPFIDTAFNGNLFMWDSSFILMFGKYARHIFDFQQTLDNFYALQHKDGFISREINETDGTERFSRHDPASTGPNIMAWCEYEYYLFTGDKSRLGKIYYPLIAYHQWMKENRTWMDGSYWSSGFGCGMDNAPRLEPKYNRMFSNGHMVWVDACFQAILSCDLLIKFAGFLGIDDGVVELEEERTELTEYVNSKLWDEKTGFYYDLYKNGTLNMVKSLASYWALVSGAVPEEKIDKFVAHLDNENEFKRPHRVPTLSYDNEFYSEDGNYWCGSVWAPTNYMVLKGLQRSGYHRLAHEIALNNVMNVTKCYKETGTLWENYAPEYCGKGRVAKKEFVGWTGIMPISVLIEYVFGINYDCESNTVVWHINLDEKHGVENLTFSDGTVASFVQNESNGEFSVEDLEIKSNRPLTVKVVANGSDHIIYVK